GYWHNLSICTEEDETPVATEYPEPFKDKKKKKKTSMLQRALSERTRSRRLTYQAEEARSCLAPQRFPHRTNTSEGKQEYQHLPNPPADFPPVPMKKFSQKHSGLHHLVNCNLILNNISTKQMGPDPLKRILAVWPGVARAITNNRIFLGGDK
ncbi:hypothetical protein AVEN_132148-1, partial [Araneus ventricosus]